MKILAALHPTPTGLVIACLFPLLPAGCGDGGGAAAEPPVTVSIGPEGGAIVHGEARVTIPAGALSAAVVLTVGSASAPRPLPAGAEAVGPVYSLTPHGQVFAAPITVELPYADERGGLSVWTLGDPDAPTWQRVPGGAFEAGRATFEVDHLSLYVVGAIPDASAAVVAEIVLPDAEPVALLVDTTGQLVVFDASTDNLVERPHLRFVTPVVDEARATAEFLVTEEALPIAWTSGPALGWMAIDRHLGLVYVLGVQGRTNHAGLSWDQLWIHVVSGRAQVGVFSPNPDGGAPASAPVDYRLAIAGLALRPAQGDDPARLVLHDIVGGDLEVIDLDATGDDMASHERVSLRPRLEERCQWPPDPPPLQCHWLTTAGSSLAYARRADDDLALVLDPNTSASVVYPVGLSRTGALAPAPLDDVDLAQVHDMFANGLEGLALAAGGERLWVATGLQSFEEGLLGTLELATLTPGVLPLSYGDRGDPAIDPSAPDRAFVAAADLFAETPALLVHELVDGAVVATTRVLERYDGGRVAAMAYDPELELLYVLVGGRVLAVRVSP
ncbi:MAG: hypothetical protein IT385_12765 [Deltaproteobacteria bacterium]|nr:hypothetical protein [Deltaproteobacteria bacterium]